MIWLTVLAPFLKTRLFLSRQTSQTTSIAIDCNPGLSEGYAEDINPVNHSAIGSLLSQFDGSRDGA
jgi:hypothetical protein